MVCNYLNSNNSHGYYSDGQPKSVEETLDGFIAGGKIVAGEGAGRRRAACVRQDRGQVRQRTVRTAA